MKTITRIYDQLESFKVRWMVYFTGMRPMPSLAIKFHYEESQYIDVRKQLALLDNAGNNIIWPEKFGLVEQQSA